MSYKCQPKREGNIGSFPDPRTFELDRDNGISSHEAMPMNHSPSQTSHLIYSYNNHRKPRRQRCERIQNSKWSNPLGFLASNPHSRHLTQLLLLLLQFEYLTKTYPIFLSVACSICFALMTASPNLVARQGGCESVVCWPDFSDDFDSGSSLGALWQLFRGDPFLPGAPPDDT